MKKQSLTRIDHFENWVEYWESHWGTCGIHSLVKTRLDEDLTNRVILGNGHWYSLANVELDKILFQEQPASSRSNNWSAHEKCKITSLQNSKEFYQQ